MGISTLWVILPRENQHEFEKIIENKSFLDEIKCASLKVTYKAFFYVFHKFGYTDK